jgi:tetratricopeptide (TPR) repeat protein
MQESRMYHPRLRQSLRRQGVALFAALALQGAQAGVNEPQFQAAFQQFQQALRGDDAAVDQAADAFGRLLQAEPADPVLLAYAGAATAMKARSALLPWKKMGYAEDGLAQIDKALQLLQPAHDALLHRGTPASLEARFVAATTFLGMPAMFHREQRGAALLEQVLKSPLFAQAPLPFQGAVWLRAGQQAQKEGKTEEARRWFTQVLEHKAPQAEAARAKLQVLKS